MANNREGIRLLIVLSIAVFAIEFAIMLLLDSGHGLGPAGEALLDSTALTLLLFPVLYFLSFRKLMAKNRALIEAEIRLLDARAQLERRVELRTLDLSLANGALAASLVRLQEKRREIEILGEMAKKFQACGNFDEAYRVAEYELRRLFREHGGALYLMKASRNQLDRVLSWGDGAAFGESFAPEQCWALRCGKPHHFGFGERAMACEHVASGPDDEHICLPIVAFAETLGTLCLRRPLGSAQDRASLAPPSAEWLQFCAAVTESLALVVANLRLRETLRNQALHDQLTGLFNRRYLIESLGREVERAASQEGTLSVVMFDIDFFKRFNDEYGHESGDAVLSSMGTLLRKRTRAGDIVARYGGEEFALVMSDTDTDLASHRVEALREEINAMMVKHNGKALGPVSISAGIAVFPKDGDNPVALLQAADAAMYEAKHAGRNRVALSRRKAGVDKGVAAKGEAKIRAADNAA